MTSVVFFEAMSRSTKTIKNIAGDKQKRFVEKSKLQITFSNLIINPLYYLTSLPQQKITLTSTALVK